MDYIGYVNESVDDDEARARILESIRFQQQKSSGEKWKSGFANNFYVLLPNFNRRVWWEYKFKSGKLCPEKKFGDYDGYEEASEKLRCQTPREFFQSIDNAIEKLGISLEELTQLFSGIIGELQGIHLMIYSK